MTRVYTKTGDGGATGLVGGTRVGKDHLRVAAYGEVDEVNAMVGVVRAEGCPADVDALLAEVQRDLFAVGAQLADPAASVAERKSKAALTPDHVRRLEEAIDERQESLPPLDAFILPGGSSSGALLHLARTVCRRAERAVVALQRTETLDAALLAYLNRLSDLLFVLARQENHRRGRAEDRW